MKFTLGIAITTTRRATSALPETRHDFTGTLGLQYHHHCHLLLSLNPLRCDDASISISPKPLVIGITFVYDYVETFLIRCRLEILSNSSITMDIDFSAVPLSGCLKLFRFTCRLRVLAIPAYPRTSCISGSELGRLSFCHSNEAEHNIRSLSDLETLNRRSNNHRGMH